MKKNIWIWNHYATNMYKNKSGRHYWFAKNLMGRGYRATIFCSNTFHNSTEFIDTKNKKYIKSTSDKIPFIFIKTTIAMGNGLDRLKNMFVFYRNLLLVAKKYVKGNEKPDVILASSVHPLTLVAGIKTAKKI